MANKITKEQRQACKMITPEARLCFPHVFTPQAPKGSTNLKYSALLLFPKFLDAEGTVKNPIKGIAPDKVTPRTLGNIMTAAKNNMYGSKENWPDDLISALKDGDSKEFAKYEGFAGHWVVQTKANLDSKPTIKDRDMNDITDPAVLYPGCYVRAYINAYCHEHLSGKRVLFGLDHIQKIRDGKSLSGRESAEQVFSPIAPEESEAEAEQESDSFV